MIARLGMFVLSRSRLVLASLALPLVLLAGCSSGDGGAPAASGSVSESASGSSAAGGSGGTVRGGFGTKPAVTIADKSAPDQLAEQVLSTGTGATVAKGDTLVANYSGQTWAGKDGKTNVFDSSFDRGKPAAFVIGTGAVIPGWDKTLV